MKGLLFLCVANSARSQMAEGIARELLGNDVLVQSAGSRPSRVNPHAVEVMREIGIDLGAHRSKSVDDVDPKTVDVVITLCAEEVCPVFLGDAVRHHWPMPDPAGDPEMPREEALARFRTARDTLRREIGKLAAKPEPAREEDRAKVLALLGASSLPTEDVGSGFPADYAVARAGDEILGVAALERHGRSGLLRSVAVQSSLRGTGLGRRLVADRLDAARRQGLDAVWLLTTTAAPFFRSLGFRDAAREAAPAEFRRSTEFERVCPSTAACLQLPLR